MQDETISKRDQGETSAFRAQQYRWGGSGEGGFQAPLFFPIIKLKLGICKRPKQLVLVLCLYCSRQLPSLLFRLLCSQSAVRVPVDLFH